MNSKLSHIFNRLYICSVRLAAILKKKNTRIGNFKIVNQDYIIDPYIK